MLNCTGKLKLDNIIQVSAPRKINTSNSTTCGQKIINLKRFSAFHTSLYWHLKETESSRLSTRFLCEALRLSLK